MSIKSVSITEFRVERRGQAEFVVISIGQRIEEIPMHQFEALGADDPLETVIRNIKTRINGLDIRSPEVALLVKSTMFRVASNE